MHFQLKNIFKKYLEKTFILFWSCEIEVMIYMSLLYFSKSNNRSFCGPQHDKRFFFRNNIVHKVFKKITQLRESDITFANRESQVITIFKL